MNKKVIEFQDDNDFVNFELMTNSMHISSNQPHIVSDSKDINLNPRKNIKSDQDFISNIPSYQMSGNIPSNKNFKEDNLNKENFNNIYSFKKDETNRENNIITSKNNSKQKNNNNYLSSNSKNSIKQNSKILFDAKIFSDDDMSLNKSNKFLNQNSIQNMNSINMNNIIDNSPTNSLLLSLNIKEMNSEDTLNNDSNLVSDIKKILPNDIYNNLNPSKNQLIANTKEGLKKLFIYLSDSLNNQKKINGSNDYYYNNDMNSDNLLKIYIYIKSILNNFKNVNNDILNESLFIINLILPLLPTNYISNICEQLIDIFYCKTAFDELNKNNYLLFKQILRLNRITFFDKIFFFLKSEKNSGVLSFWEKFLGDLIEKNNENYGIGFDINNNESIINLLNEYYKEDLTNFCLNLFNYDDINEITTNNQAFDLIKCIYKNKILSKNIENDNESTNDNRNNISFKNLILNKVKDNKDLFLIIKNIFDEEDKNNKNNINNMINNFNSNDYDDIESNNNIEEYKIHKSKIKKINIDNNNLEDKKSSNNINAFQNGTSFKGSFGFFINNKNNDNEEYEKIKNNYDEINFKNNYNNNFNNEDNGIFEIMNNNIISQYNQNNYNNLNQDKKNNKKEKVFTIDLTEEDDENNKEEEIELNINKIISKEKNISDESYRLSNFSEISSKLPKNRLSNYNDKNSGDSLLNYKYSSSNIDIKDDQNEKSSNNNKNTIKKNIHKEDNTFDKRTTLNNNIFSSFSSFSSFKGINNNVKKENTFINNDIDMDKDLNYDNEIDKKVIDNNNLLNLIKNKLNDISDNDNCKYKNNSRENINVIENHKMKEMNNNNMNNDEDKIIKDNKDINIIDNNNFLNLINNNINQNKKNENENKSISNNNKQNSNKKISIKEEKNSFDYIKCLNIIDKEKWSEKQTQINLLKQELDKNLTKQNYNNSNIEIDMIINLINKKLKDKQQKLVILILEVLEIIVNKLEEVFNEVYLSDLSKALIYNLNDNNMQLRYKTGSVILKIISYSKKDFFIVELINALKQDKNNIRIELLTILNQYFSQNQNNTLKKSNKNFFNILIESLILCLEDKFSKIRNLSEELIKLSTKYIPKEKYYEASKKLCGKVFEDKINSKINELYCIDKNLNININQDDNNKLLASTIDNSNINKSKKLTIKKGKNEFVKRSKSFDENQNITKIKKNNNTINNVNDINKNINNSIDYKDVFKKNVNFIENKKFRNNKDIKLGKNFLTIKEKGNLANFNNINNSNDIKPLSQIFSNEYINICIIPYNKNLKLILFHLNKVISNCDNNFKTDFLMNLDIILEFIIRLFDYSINNNKFDFIEEYLKFVDNIYEKLIIKNLKTSGIEIGYVLHSLLFLSKFQKESILYIKKFYKLLSINKTLKILFEYNDLSDIDVQKNIIDLFKNEFLRGNIDITNDNFFILKKIIKLFYKEELIIYAKVLIKNIYDIIGDNIFNEFISKLNKQDRNIILNSIDFNFKINENNTNMEKNSDENIKDFNNGKIIKKKIVKNNNNIKNNNYNKNSAPPLNVKFNNPRVNLNNNIKIKNNITKNETTKNNINYKDNSSKNDIINNNETKQFINDNTIKYNIMHNFSGINKNDIDRIEVINKNKIIELIKNLSLQNNEINLEQLSINNNITSNIIINKLKLLSIIKDLFTNSSNYNNIKKILEENIELIFDSLSIELNLFLNINTIDEEFPKNILEYIENIINIFYIISTKNDLIILLKENIINKVLILFLNYLEIDKDEKISRINDTFHNIIKRINKITLNIIQKSNRNLIYIVLLKLISNFKEENDIALLGINCLVKLIKITDFAKIDYVKILTEIIISVDDEELIKENNSKNNELFLKTIKKLLNQLVIERKYNILKDYQIAINKCNVEDEKVCDWIQKILEHYKY